MSGHLPLDGTTLRWGRLESRAEIEAYVAERREVLTRLCWDEGLGEFRKPEPVQTQLELEEAA
jgi:hypothetical protein